MNAPRPRVTRVCPHCKATILASAAVCPSCRHHLRFDPAAAAARAQHAISALRVEGTVRQPADTEAWEYSMVLSIRNERGEEIDRKMIGVGAMKEGMEQPVYYWDPVIAPSGMLFYTGDEFPEWKNNVFVGGLASNALVRLVLENGRVTKEERYLHDLHERIRDVQQGVDGYIYVVTDNANGRILRVRPR